MQVEIEYRVPFSSGPLSGHGRIPLPQSDLTVTQLRWRLQLPEPFQLKPTTSGTTFGSPTIGWRQRLLGPLGLAAGQPGFWPLWSLLGGVEGPASDRLPQPETSFRESLLSETVLDGFRVEQRSLPFTLNELQIEVWNASQAHRLGWMLLLVAFLLTAVIRRMVRQASLSAVAGWVAVSGIAAILVNDAWAVPWGGIFLGSLMGLVLPTWISIPRFTEAYDPGTVEKSRILVGASAVLLLVLSAYPHEGFAFQEERLERLPSTSASAPLVGDATAPEFDVLVPVTSGTPTYDETPVVYYSQEFLQHGRATSATLNGDPPYLLRAVDYRITTDFQWRPRVMAHFDVLLLNRETIRRIALPLKGIAIEDAAPCRVNGRPATVIPLRDASGLVIEIPEQVLGQSTVPESDATDSAIQIELSFRAPAGDLQKLRRARFGIPVILSSSAELKGAAASLETTAISGFGALALDREAGVMRRELGAVGVLSIDGNRTLAENSAASDVVPVQAVTWVDVHPLQLEFRSRLTFDTRPDLE
ncbi:MAG: hypothetical protein KF861_24400, partial [Planctomycetaceae bacterium]|nr:hypothetical protein [Planctomycetaceae bacterium]